MVPAVCSKLSHIRASIVPVQSPSSRRKKGLPSRVERISFPQTRKNDVIVWSALRSATNAGFIGLLSSSFRKGETCVCPSFRKEEERDRKSTRLNSSHVAISYAVFCLKKKR